MSDYAEQRTRFREAMARMGAAVNIITTCSPQGDTGVTITAACSVTDDPPTVLVCLNRVSKQYEIFGNSGIICVNVLAPEHKELSPVFAGNGGLPMPQRFALAKWQRLVTGAPVLESAAAGLDCTVSQSVDIGTHTVFFCAVQAIYLGESGAGLVYHGRAYHRIATKIFEAS